MNRPIGALVLLAIFAALGAFVYFTEVRPAQEQAAAGPTPSPRDVFTLKDVQIDRMVLSGPGQRWAAEKTGDDWQMVEPAPGPADGREINSGFLSLESLRAFRLVAEDDPELAKFGLADPVVSVEVRTTSGEIYGLSFGSENVDKQYRFAKRHDRPAIYLIHNDTYRRFERLLQLPPYQPTPTPASPAAAITPAG